MRLMMLKERGSPLPSIPVADLGDGTLRRLDSLLRRASEDGLLPRSRGVDLDAVFSAGDVPAVISWLKGRAGGEPEIDQGGFVPDIPLRCADLVCVGRNYADHARELNNPVPSEPILFMKPRACLVPSGAAIRIPADAVRVELEGEIALVLGKDLDPNAGEEEALDAVYGCTLFNDITDRGRQAQLKKEGKPWLAAKGRPTFAPCGPAIWVFDDLDSFAGLEFRTSINGVVCQEGRVTDWIWPPGKLVAAVTRIIPLRRGTIIATGTPAGVREIRYGDRIRIESGPIGTLENEVR